MLYSITGTVQAVFSQSIAICAGSISYEASVPEPAAFVQGKEVTLYVHTHWNQEQGPALYGFSSSADKAIFITILSCSGVGPKIALSVLAQLGAQSFVHAVEQEDIKGLSKVNGIGVKKAEQMIVQLKHKISTLAEAGVGADHAGSDWQTVTQALRALNYSSVEIAQALNHLKKNEATGSASFDALMRRALSHLAK